MSGLIVFNVLIRFVHKRCNNESWLFGGMTGQNTGKTVAIILGGAAGVAFLVILLLFARGLIKKDGMCSMKLKSHYCSNLLI